MASTASCCSVYSTMHGSVKRSPLVPGFNHLRSSLSSTFQPLLRELQQVPMIINVSEEMKKASQRLLDAFVDSTFKFVDQPWLPSQRNFAPVEEIGEMVAIDSIEGEMPADFPQGLYIRNGSNPLFGALKSTESVFGRSSNIWVEGEGMLHALYFTKDSHGEWKIFYKNKFVESETFELERERNSPCFLPTIEGDSPAILAAYLLNQLRFGKINKYISNTNVFEHSGKLYSTAENHIPQEIDILSLDTYGNWDVGGAWDRPFTAHPKKVPGSGELIITGCDAKKPYLVLGVISADGKKLKHKVDLKLNRSVICHDIGVTKRYSIIMDMPLTIDINRLIKGGPLIKFDKGCYARIGVLPHYGDSDSVKWFEVEAYCAFHIINCFENGDEVVVRGCRSPGSIIPGPDLGRDKVQWFSRGFMPETEEEELACDPSEALFFSRVYEWRLNMKTGNVSERYLTGSNFSADFPMVNSHYLGLYNKYGYAQVVDCSASSICALPKYGGLAKFCFEEVEHGTNQIKVEHHKFGRNEFCSGAAFVSKQCENEEDDGWVVSFVHNEDTNTSYVHIIDTKRFESDPVIRITLPRRVPYGFHSTYIPMHTKI